MADALYNFVRMDTKADIVPDYMRRLTFQEVCAYFFNWHPHQNTATFSEVETWFRRVRGWELVAV